MNNVVPFQKPRNRIVLPVKFDSEDIGNAHRWLEANGYVWVPEYPATWQSTCTGKYFMIALANDGSKSWCLEECNPSKLKWTTR
jgi:hypothetical protein